MDAAFAREMGKRIERFQELDALKDEARALAESIEKKGFTVIRMDADRNVRIMCDLGEVCLDTPSQIVGSRIIKLIIGFLKEHVGSLEEQQRQL